jgi:uncharacterized protein (DUF1800 family)
MTAALHRRTLLTGASLGVLAPVLLLPGCATAPPAAVPGPADAGDVALLNRLTWGVDSAGLAALQRQGRRGWLQAQLHPPARTVLSAAVQAQIDGLGLRQQPMPALLVAMEQRKRDAEALTDPAARQQATQAWQQAMNQLAADAASITLLHALHSPDQLREQMTWFWFNHFNVHQHKGNLRAMVGDYEAGLRQHALGRFSDLLIASATHAAMLRYLDNERNAANRLNENFARELMELHTLGVDGGYSQRDVQELARVLTGLGVAVGEPPALRPALAPLYVRQGATEFNPQRHDMGEKLVLGQRVSGRGWDEIIDQLLRLARHPATARHISRQLAIYLVADQPEPALVERMAQAFTASDGDIAVTLAAMVAAPSFAPSLGRKFKDPMHYVVSAMRLARDGQPVTDTAPMIGWLNRLGQGLYNRQTPDGYPLDSAPWTSSGQLATRFDIARSIGAGASGAAPATPPAMASGVARSAWWPTLGGATRAALDQAATPQAWNALLLSSPEFMAR